MIYVRGVVPGFISSIVVVLVVLYAVYTGNFFLLFAAYIFGGIVQAILTYTGLRSDFRFRLTVNKLGAFSKTLFLKSWPLGLMLVFNLLYSKIDVVLLSFYKPSFDVGIYGVSYRFFEVALALPAFLANSTYPVLLKHMSDGRSYKTIFAKYLKLYIVLSLIVTAIVFLGAPFITILKGGFFLSVFPLQLLSLSLPFFFLTSLLQWHFLIKNKLGFLVPLYGGALVLNIVLNIILLPHFSYYAAALITGVCEALVFVVMLWYFRK
jgi:O-antigen/teichoic acid export membrane protein